MAVKDRPSPNHDNRPDGRTIDMLVLHYTGMRDAASAIDRMCDPVAEVSAHYLIDEDGAVMRLVDEDRRAWHAGIASWRGATDINARSVGIELVNPGHEFGYRPFPEPQMIALVDLARDIVVRHAIPARNVVGHSDVAPRRKQDPGELFDWRKLAAEGVGLWPEEPNTLPISEPKAVLAKIGYEISDITASLRAFQRHFLPDHLTGKVDARTLECLAAVLRLVNNGDSR